MPCVGVSRDDDSYEDHQRELKWHNERHNNYATVIDALTAKLCFACRTFGLNGIDIPLELAEWYAQHKAEDDRRIANEKLRMQEQEAANRRKQYLESVRDRLLCQLSDEEKESLGIK